MAAASAPPQLSWRRLQALLRRPPSMLVTPEEFTAIQARVWARLAQTLEARAAAGH